MTTMMMLPASCSTVRRTVASRVMSVRSCSESRLTFVTRIGVRYELSIHVSAGRVKRRLPMMRAVSFDVTARARGAAADEGEVFFFSPVMSDEASASGLVRRRKPCSSFFCGRAMDMASSSDWRAISRRDSRAMVSFDSVIRESRGSRRAAGDGGGGGAGASAVTVTLSLLDEPACDEAGAGVEEGASISKEFALRPLIGSSVI